MTLPRVISFGIRAALLLFILSYGWILPLYGEESDTASIPEPETVRYDSTTLAPRYPSESKYDELVNSSDFLYDRELPPEGLWEKFIHWLRSIYDDFFSTKEGNELQRILLYALFGATVVYVIYKIAKTNGHGLLSRRSAKTTIPYNTIEENIHEMDFTSLLQEALTSGNYRRAVRLYYLQALRELTERSLIEWRPEKTNHEYLGELRSPGIRERFAQTTTMFEYVWYGEFPVREPEFQRIQQTFTEFTDSLSTQQ